MKSFQILLTAAIGLLLFSFSGVCRAGDLIKVGVVDFQQIMNESATGKSVQDEVNRKGQAMKEEIESAQSDIQAFQDKARREAPLLDDEQKKEIDRQMRMKLNDLRVLQERHTHEFNVFKNERIGIVKERVVEAAQKITQEKGCLLIVEKQSGAVLYEDKSLQLTAQFIDAVDKPAASDGKKD